jgi:hypothetical protein
LKWRSNSPACRTARAASPPPWIIWWRPSSRLPAAGRVARFQIGHAALAERNYVQIFGIFAESE